MKKSSSSQSLSFSDALRKNKEFRGMNPKRNGGEHSVSKTKANLIKRTGLSLKDIFVQFQKCPHNQYVLRLNIQQQQEMKGTKFQEWICSIDKIKTQEMANGNESSSKIIASSSSDSQDKYKFSFSKGQNRPLSKNIEAETDLCQDNKFAQDQVIQYSSKQSPKQTQNIQPKTDKQNKDPNKLSSSSVKPPAGLQFSKNKRFKTTKRKIPKQ